MFFCAALPAGAQATTVDIMRRMDAHNKALRSLKADVTVVKYDATLKVTDTMIGEVKYIKEAKKRKAMIRLDWKTENGRYNEDSIAIKDGRFTLYQPRLNQVITGSILNAKRNPEISSVFGLLSMPKSQFKAKYLVIYVGEEQVKDWQYTWHLQLTPKVKTIYKSADLWVDADGMRRQVGIVAPNNDTTTVLLSNLQKNKKIKRSVFDLKYDKKKVKVRKFSLKWFSDTLPTNWSQSSNLL